MNHILRIDRSADLFISHRRPCRNSKWSMTVGAISCKCFVHEIIPSCSTAGDYKISICLFDSSSSSRVHTHETLLYMTTPRSLSAAAPDPPPPLFLFLLFCCISSHNNNLSKGKVWPKHNIYTFTPQNAIDQWTHVWFVKFDSLYFVHWSYRI